MNFVFAVGETVEYRPAGGRTSLYTVMRQMPAELQVSDRTYRIKSDRETFERNVVEGDLRTTQAQRNNVFRLT